MLQFHGEFTSSDASALTEANSRFTLYNATTKAAITVASTDRVVITDREILAGAALTVELYDGANATVDAGEKISHGTFDANGGVAGPFATPHTCLVGTYPKVKTSVAGGIKAIIRGYILRG